MAFARRQRAKTEALHDPRPEIFDHHIGRGDQVVPTAEATAVPRQRDHVYLPVEVRLLHALGQLHRHRLRDPVPALGPVQRDPRNPLRYVVQQRLHGTNLYVAQTRSTIIASP